MSNKCWPAVGWGGRQIGYENRYPNYGFMMWFIFCDYLYVGLDYR